MTAVVTTCNHLPLGRPSLLTEPRGRVPFPSPKKLGSDRLLLVSKALHETPTYKALSPELLKQRDSLKPSNHGSSGEKRRRVCFRAVDCVHEYEKEYDESDHANMWFNSYEFDSIFDRDDDDFRACFGSMAHTKQILQLWGMCSRGAESAEAVDALFRQAPHPHARGLEHRIITGIRNHRQKAVQSFLQMQKGYEDSVCSRYLKFSQTAGRLAQALAQGDARVAQIIQNEPPEEDEEDLEQYNYEWGY